MQLLPFDHKMGVNGVEQIIDKLYEKKANKIQASDSDGGGFGDAGSYSIDA